MTPLSSEPMPASNRRNRQGPRSIRFDMSFWFLLIIILSLSCILPCHCAKTKRSSAFEMPPEDPYKVLGVSQRASQATIKKAYRQKARDTHPDKHPDVDPDMANERFRRVVQAFELLSNPSHKRTYDFLSMKMTNKKKQPRQQRKHTYTNTHKKQQKNGHTSYTFKTNNGNSNSQHQQQKEYPHSRRAQILKDAKEAQQHVLKLSSLEQLLQSTSLVDRNRRFTKHFLCVFVAGKKVEHYVTDDLLFPYPFAGQMSDNHDIQWQEILQTAKVRYNGPTPLTQAFGVPSVQSANKSGKPYIVFARKGNTMDQFQVYRQTQQGYVALEEWVRKQLRVQLTIVNYHHAPIQLFSMNGSSTNKHKQNGNNIQIYEKPVPSGHQITLVTFTGDRILLMDANVDQFPGSTGWKSHLLQQHDLLQRVLLDDVLVGSSSSDAHQTVEIGAGYGTTRRCYDLSLQCHSWATTNVCQDQAEVAHSLCPKWCGVCVDAPWNGAYYTLFHLPLHKVPTPILRGALSTLRSTATFLDVFWDDLTHLLSMRRNVAAGFILAGLLCGIQIVVLAQGIVAVTTTTSTTTTTANNRMHDSERDLLIHQAFVLSVLVLLLFGWGAWLCEASSMEVPAFLQGFQLDLVQMVRKSMDAIYALLYLGCLSWIIAGKLAQRLRAPTSSRSGPRHTKSNLPTFLFLWLTVSNLVLWGFTYLLQNDNPLVDWRKNQRSIRWKTIWRVRKIAAVVVFVVGCLVGALALSVGQLVWQPSVKRYIGLTLLNASVLLGGGSLAFQDRYFADDLDHVLSMRMSAAIPCAILGMMWGLGFAHILSTYQVKVKVD